MACVVISYRNEPTLIDAVRSVLAQDVPLEIVVVNSGGGGAEQSIRAAGLNVPVIEYEERMYAGGARNAGLTVTHAPFVAFLAADCVAEPGWARQRLIKHRAGARAVASALTHVHKRNLCSWAMYIALYTRRMPHVPPDQRLYFGVSYERALFDAFGLFNAALETGEDSDFNARLTQRGVKIEWAADVLTAHRNVTSPVALLRDQFKRGRRMARAQHELGMRSPRKTVARNAITRTPKLIRMAWSALPPAERRYVALAVPLLVPSALAYALGALRYDPTSPQEKTHG